MRLVEHPSRHHDRRISTRRFPRRRLNVLVDNSEIAGVTATISGSGNVIGGSKLDDSAAAAGNTCAGVWDENYTFSASTCP